MTKVRIENVSKYFGEVKGVDNADLTIEDGEFSPCSVQAAAAKQPCCEP